MASDTNIKKPRSSFDKLMDLYWGGTERRISALTIKIIGINALSLIILMLGITTLSQYENQLLKTQINAFSTQSRLMTDIISRTPKNEIPNSLEWLALSENQQITYIDQNMRPLYQAGAIGGIDEQNAVIDNTPISIKTLRNMARLVLNIIPKRKTLPYLPESIPARSDTQIALTKHTPSIAAWQSDHYKLVLTATIPLFKNDQPAGALHFARASDDITKSIGAFWGQMLKIFAITLGITITISIYLSGLIARPLKRLARAAETIRRNKSLQTEIPDFSNRHDEIGELSLVMRDMAESLHNKMNAIESFAADVAHELKNPLTSLKSAVETLKITKKKNNQTSLLNVLQHDIERMDRLLTDIAITSKLDTELSRRTWDTLNLNAIITNTVSRYQNTQKTTIITNIPQHTILRTEGIEERIIQVLDNLITNAISFSKTNSTITITATQHRKTIQIIIQDQGPGIPENKLETIFERFYSERPNTESFGEHSGLGLAICKQIITALGGTITAENITSPKGRITGAQFIITLIAT